MFSALFRQSWQEEPTQITLNMATDLPLAFLHKLTWQYMESLTVEVDHIHVAMIEDELDVTV